MQYSSVHGDDDYDDDMPEEGSPSVPKSRHASRGSTTTGSVLRFCCPSATRRSVEEDQMMMMVMIAVCSNGSW